MKIASDYTLDGGRIGKDGAVSITWQAVCETSVTDYVKTDKAIVAATAASPSHTPVSESFQIRWRNKTDYPAGSFNTLVTGSGELRAGTSAGCITNTDSVGSGCGCEDVGMGDSEETENESPLQTASLSAGTKDYSIEVQACVDFSNALDGKEYQFILYSVTESVSTGTLAATITTEAVYCEPQTDSRIANASASWQGVCDVDITDWVRGVEFILSTYATGGDGENKIFRLKWRRAGGSWYDVGAGNGDIVYGTATVLVDGNNIANPAGCLTSTKSEENEGDLEATLDTMGASDVGEIQWGLEVDPFPSLDDQEYEFKLVCVTDSTEEVCSCSIRTAPAVAGNVLEGKLINRKINPYINERIN